MMPSLFVNCDWGTTHFRLRLFDLEAMQARAVHESDQGVGVIAANASPSDRPARFRAVLEAGLKQLLAAAGPAAADAPVLISGMASSSIGWHELPYAPVPLHLDGSDLAWRELPPAATGPGSQRVILISGARTTSDILRGEETQAIGVFELPDCQPFARSSRLILTGTHSKHLTIESGQIVDFRTFMTGELFEVLSRHSILRHSVSEPADAATPPNLDALREGVRCGASAPLPRALFQVRTRQVLDHRPSWANRAFLTGLLIGAELEYLRSCDAGPVVLAAGSAVCDSYQIALRELGISEVTVIAPADVDRLSALGQARLLRYLQESAFI